MAKMKAVKIGRNASTGRFTSVKAAQRQPRTHVVETIKRPVAIGAAPAIPPPPPRKK